MAQVKKLSVATVYGKIDLKEVLNAEKPVPVMRAYGVAVGTKTGTSAYGDWTALIGQFKAVNLKTGEVSEAAQLFLPEVALTPLRVALSRNENRSVRFALDIKVQPAKNSKPGGVPYEYTFEHLLPPAEDDPLLMLEAEMKEVAALPAPEPKVKAQAKK
jgi:hypothetical protein